MSTWIKGEILAKTLWADGLFSLKIAAGVAPFKAGQYTSLALEIDGQLHAEPYSLLSAPGVQPLEFFLYSKLEGTLSTRLSGIEVGSEVRVQRQPEGGFVLDQVATAPQLWFLATGTGVAPFLSMLQTEEPWQRFEQIILVYAVRWHRDLCYLPLIESLQQRHPGRLIFVPIVSRESVDGALAGRIQAAIEDGSLETFCGHRLSREHSQIMLCGNPGMVKETSELLMERGFQENTGDQTGQLTFEAYW